MVASPRFLIRLIACVTVGVLFDVNGLICFVLGLAIEHEIEAEI